MQKWRYILEDGVGAAYGLAADELLLERAAPGGPALRLYTYRSHCALIGLFQCLSAEVDVETCSQLGIQLGRRPTGGGAIIMGADQLGVAMASPPEGSGMLDRSLADRCHRAVLAGLARLGLHARFQPKNDIVVSGRKICGTGALKNEEGSMLYHASVLLDLDVALMRKALRAASAKNETNEGGLLQALTSVRKELARDVSMQELRDSIATGFSEEFRVLLEPDGFSPKEISRIGQLEKTKYANPAWIDSVKPGHEPLDKWRDG